MGYALGVDLGTTYTAAAIYRDGRTETVTLGTRSLMIPSVVFLKEDGEFLTGEAAERRGVGANGGAHECDPSDCVNALARKQHGSHSQKHRHRPHHQRSMAHRRVRKSVKLDQKLNRNPKGSRDQQDPDFTRREPDTVE